MPKSKSKLNYTNDKSFLSNSLTSYTSFNPSITFTHSQDSSFQTLMSLYTSSSATAEPPYDLTLSLPDLLLPKLKSNGLPTKPRNAFILFLKDYAAKIRQQPPNKNQNLTINEISYYAAKEWNLQPPHVIRFFEILSMTAKEIHQSLYPDYNKYRSKIKHAKIKINENKINTSINNNSINNNTINNSINHHTINNSINNSINIPNIPNIPSIPVITTSADSFPNLDVDFELYDEPKEEEIYFSLF